ncbi:MAG: hypothetical protein GX991_06350 [Clostridiaceae bacterium]|nr:hypothetical protein [Clostridiaceae bacterium]
MKTLKKRKRNRSRFLVKPIVAILLLAFVVGVMPGFVQAEREAKLVTMPTSDKSKREVVFARLRATGDVDNVYVVNHFNPARMSSLTDYGDYEEVIQLTGSVPPVLSGTTVSIAEAEGPYYYQGNLRSRELPWFFEMTWRLDGETIYPERLSGVSGELELEMSVKRNDQVDADFFDHYALQISIPIDPERAQIVAASEGFIVSYAGTEQQMTYMALPGLETTVKAIFDVKDFAMGQITIAGVPLVLNIDMDALGEFDDMLTPLSELESGIAEFADGATKLRQGYKKLLDAYNKMRDGGGKLVSGGKELTSGANQLKAGVGDYTSGVDRYVRGVQQLSSGFQAFDKGVRAMYQGTQLLKGESAQLVNASSSILGGLNEIVDRLPPPESFDGVEIPEITPEMENELEKLKQGSEVIRIGLEALATDGGGISQLVFGLRQVKEQLNFLKTQASQFAIPMSPVVSRDANEWKTYMEALGFSYSDTGSPEVEQSFYAQLATMSKYASDYRAAVIMLRGAIEGLLIQITALETGANAVLSTVQGLSRLYGGYFEGSERVPGIHDGVVELVDGVLELAGLSDKFSPLLEEYPKLVKGLRELRDGYAGEYDANGQPVIGSDGKPKIGFHGGLKAYIEEGVGGLLSGYEGGSGQPGILAGSTEIKQGLGVLANSGRQITSGGSELMKGLEKTGKGISDYVDGVTLLNKGLDRYRSDGLIPYYDGLVKFEEGGKTLKDETSNLPQKFEDAIRELMEEYGESFEIKSFVSDKNKDVASVQFVFMTEEIPPKAK